MALLVATVLFIIAGLLLLFTSPVSAATYTNITQFQSLADDNSTLLSDDGSFEFGFFSPGSSSNRYAGIWYKNIPIKTVVWVANRDNPIQENSSELRINGEGNLVLLTQNHTPVWSTNLNTNTRSPFVQLLNNGNLVLKNQNDQSILWQSFNHPSDTFLPGMKLGWDLKKNHNRIITAWKNWDDPSSGNFTLGIELGNNPELVMWKGSVVYHRSGPWNGLQLFNAATGNNNNSNNTPPLYNYTFVNNEDEVYYSYNNRDAAVIARVVMNQTANQRQRWKWNSNTGQWDLGLQVPKMKDECGVFDVCGLNRICIGPDDSPSCHDVPMATPGKAESAAAKHGHRTKVAVGITFVLVLVVGILLTFTYIYIRRQGQREKKNDDQQEVFELPFFDLATIVKATNDFSPDNKLGEGGFGPVYKGILANGQEIAVKRLSGSSRQGFTEFKNEVILCAKLQHRNLVKVLGCCLEGEEKILIYEYLPNKSLDSFLFDSTQSKVLDWPRRFRILCGFARGLLYLHQDSRLRIIHRDLKASNILLDNEMNPKISDFGLARMCGGDQMDGNTSKIVGTYGYMAPEYAIDGLFSIKSDVFSFGILLLEIVSGKKNRGLYHQNQSWNLIGHAWRLWKDCIPLEVIDDCLRDSCNVSEALRCIHIGLLCVQHNPYDRPNMSAVVVMLSSESGLPQPKEPGFLLERVSIKAESASGKQSSCSINEVTMSILDAR